VAVEPCRAASEPFFFRFRSIRAKSARVGVPIPEALASMPIAVPLTKPALMKDAPSID
jgi:hypothetical protein